MIAAPSDVADFDEDELASSEQRPPTLVSLHFIRNTLRQRWLVCVLSGILGLLAAASFLLAFPASHNAKAALVLVHQEGDDPTLAMATDVSLLKTRTVASKTIADLGLTTMAPEDFLKSVTAVPVSSELLSITITAPSDAEAVRRLGALTSVYLEFRGEQLSRQSNLYVDGIHQRIDKLEGEIASLSQRIEQLSEASNSSTSKLSDAVAQRAFIQGRIDTLQQSIEDVTLRTTSVVASSRVIDPAAPEAHAAKRRIALALASGLIGGAAVGCGTVLFLAITSDRLRRRADVAAALETPVPVSVGRLTPLPKGWLRLPQLRTIESRRTAERQRLAQAIKTELPAPHRSARLAVICIDNAQEVRFAVATAAEELTVEGRSVAVIDLTKQSSLDPAVVPSMVGATQELTVLRPRGVPTLSSAVADLRVVGDNDDVAASRELSDVTLVLADFDPSVGADYLLTWTDRVIIAVTAGRSSAEMVRTAGDLVRSTGLELRMAALLHSERTDDSSGTAGFERPIHLVEKRDRLELVGTTVDVKTATANNQAVVEDAELAALRMSAADEETAPEEEQVVVDDQTANEELSASEHIAQDGDLKAEIEQATEEEEDPAEEKTELTDEEQLGAQEQLAGQQVAEEEQLATQEIAEEEQLADENYLEQLADEVQLFAEEEPPAIKQEQPAAEDQLVEDESAVTAHTTQADEASGEVEPAVDDDQTVEMRAVVSPEPAEVEEQTPVDQEQDSVDQGQAGLREQRSEDELAMEDDAAGQMAAVEEAFAEERDSAVAEPPEDMQGANGWQLFFLENPLVFVQSSPDDDELDWSWNWLEEPNSKHNSDSALLPVDDQTEVLAEPDVVPQSFVEIDPHGWALYIDVYPPVYLAPTPSSEDDELNWNWDWDSEERPASNGKESNGHESNGKKSDGHPHDQNEAQVSEMDQPAQADHKSSRV